MLISMIDEARTKCIVQPLPRAITIPIPRVSKEFRFEKLIGRIHVNLSAGDVFSLYLDVLF